MPEAYYLIPMVPGPYSRANPQRPEYVDEIRCNWTGHNVDALGYYVCKVNTTEAKHTDLAGRAGVQQLPRNATWNTVIADLPGVARNAISAWCVGRGISYEPTETIGDLLQRVIASGLFALGGTALTTAYQDLTVDQQTRISVML